MNKIAFAPPPQIRLNVLLEPEVISIQKEYDTRGHAPLKVLCQDGKHYVAKNAGPHVPPCILISEFLGHFLLRVWGLPTPPAAVINLSPDYVSSYKNSAPDRLSRRHIPHHYNKPCFGSRVIPNAVEVGPLHQTSRTEVWRQTDNFFDLLLLTLFDIWIENDDRKPGNPNLLLESRAKKRHRWMAIDHAFCFSTMDFDSLDPAYLGVSFNDSLLHAPMLAGLKRLMGRYPGWTTAIEQAFYLRVQACKAAFSTIASLIPAQLDFSSSLQTNVADFLFDEDRHRLVLSEYFAHFTRP